jgi:hypothetical protein
MRLSTFISTTVSLSSSAFLIMGCSIHPLPEDVARDNTYDIVQKIRCEGREALDNISVRLLRQVPDQQTRDFAEQVANGELTVIDLFFNEKYRRRLKLDESTKALFLAYTLSAVTFDFQFLISEQNKGTAIVNARLPVTSGTFLLGGNLGAQLDRKSTRKFQVTNSFYELHKLDRARCANITTQIGNIIYPITGKIGLEEVFDTFIRLDASIGVTNEAPNKFTDTLTFTTKVNGDVTPKITLNPLPVHSLRLADASATLSSFREDQHQVAIAIAKATALTENDWKALLALDQRILNKARLDAKLKSIVIANDRRVEDLFIIPRDRINIVQ